MRLGCLLAVLAFTQWTPGAVRPDELARRDAWVERGLAKEEQKNPVGLRVLANHDPVIRNSRGGRPLNLAGKEYNRGLYCHANSRIVVNLPGPAKSLSAIIGVDSNDQTRPGRGSVVFSVEIDGNPIVKTLKPLRKLKEADVRGDSLQATFLAAIAVRLEGEGALAAHPDPFDGKPFGTPKPSDGAYIRHLASRCPPIDEDTITLTVRPGPVR